MSSVYIPPCVRSGRRPGCSRACLCFLRPHPKSSIKCACLAAVRSVHVCSGCIPDDPWTVLATYGAGISGVSSCIPNNRALGRMKVADLPVHEMGQTPANVHGASRFIVKIQSAAGAAHSPHMIYDQSRSFTGFLDPRIGAGYHRASAVIGNHGFMGRKIYLWAFRVAPDRLRIFLDKRPSQDQRW